MSARRVEIRGFVMRKVYKEVSFLFFTMDEKNIKNIAGFCDYYLEHKPDNLIGDNHVFHYDVCGLMCDKFDCENNTGGCFLIEGDAEIGLCLTDGKKEKSELVGEVEKST
jgi:hypothetical protein